MLAVDMLLFLIMVVLSRFIAIISVYKIDITFDNDIGSMN